MAQVEDLGPHTSVMENALSEHSDKLIRLEARVKQLQYENSQLKSKTDPDLENHSCRNNLRVVGLPEDCEGRSTTDFMSKFLVDILQDGTFTSPPELDRAHHTLRQKPATGERPVP